jgi:uncharacterized protein YkwD
MLKSIVAMFVAIAMLAACQPAPQPRPTEPPTVPATPTAVIPPTSTATPPPTATAVPTTAPATAPTVVPTGVPTLALTAQPTTAPMLQVQVNSPDVGYLNVRDTPSAGGALVAQVKDEAMLDVLSPERADTAKGLVGQQGQWLKVRTSEGKEGFVATWYLRLPGTSPAPALQPTAILPTPEAGGAELELFNRTNALRAQSGLPPYTMANRLNAAAQRHSQDMANTGQIGHIGSDGSSAKRRVLDTGYGDWPVGENVFGGVATVDDVWQFWSGDPDHRNGLLSQQFRDVGVYVARGKSGMFYYTMDFGARPPQAPEPTATPVPTLVSVVPLPPTATPNPALDSALLLFDRTNALRTQNGLPPYKLNDKLNASAQRHSQDMAGTGKIDHAGSDGSTARRRILDTGYEAQFTGENIFGGMVTVDDTWDYWVNDPPHRDILLNKLFTDIGVSVVKGARGAYYYTMDLAR